MTFLHLRYLFRDKATMEHGSPAELLRKYFRACGSFNFLAIFLCLLNVYLKRLSNANFG